MRLKQHLLSLTTLGLCAAAPFAVLAQQQQPATPVAPAAAPAPAIAAPTTAVAAPATPAVASVARPAAAPVAVLAPSAPSAVSAPARVAQSTPPAAPSAPATPQGFSFFFSGDNFLGVGVEDVTRENQLRFNLNEPRGVAVTSVQKDSPAERAGLRANDVIVRFDDEAVTSARKLNRLIDESAPGHSARLTVLRNGSEQTFNVTLGRRENRAGLLRGEVFRPGQVEQLQRGGEEVRRRMEEWQRSNPGVFAVGFAGRRLGVSTTRLTEQLADHLGVNGGRGLLVTSVSADSPAAKAGLKAGDVITEVEGSPVAAAGDLTRAVNRKSEGEVTLSVVRDKKTRTVRVTPERAPAGATPGAELFELYSGDFPSIALSLPQISLPKIELPAITLPRIEMRTPRVVVPPVRVRVPEIGSNVML